MKIEVSSNIIEKVGPRQKTKKGKRTDKVVPSRPGTDNDYPL